MDFSDKLHEAMVRQGIFIDGEINWSDTKFQRFKIKGRWKKGKPLFVVLYNGGASFGDWREPSTWTTIWAQSWREISIAERATRKLEMQKLEWEREALRNKAIWRAQELLNHQTWQGRTCGEASLDHPYIKRKRIHPYYARQVRSYVVLPITDVEGSLLSLQYIKPNGWKQFKKGASPKGGMLRMYERIEPDDVIRVCEGYATGATIYEAIGKPVVVAFSAGNLEAVCLTLRLAYPSNEIHVCGDNDPTGISLATLAAERCGGKVYIPNFTNLDASSKPTDWNDLMCLTGIEEVEDQLVLPTKYV